MLSLAEVCDVTLVVDASGVVTSASTVPHAARNKRHLCSNSVYCTVDLRKVALDQRGEPPTVHFLPDEIPVESKVPEVLVITGNKFERVSLLFLHPSDASLTRRRQVIPV